MNELDRVAQALLKHAIEQLRAAAKMSETSEAASAAASEVIVQLVERVLAGALVREDEVARAYAEERRRQDVASFYSILLDRLSAARDLALQNHQRAAALSANSPEPGKP